MHIDLRLFEYCISIKIGKTIGKILDSHAVAIDCKNEIENIVIVSGITMISHNYPDKYLNDQDCKMVITAPDHLLIRIQFHHLNVEGKKNSPTDANNECSDWLEIHDGNDSSSVMIGSRICGQELPMPIKSSGNNLFFRFVTDSEVQGNGFKIDIEIGEPKINDN